MDESTLTALSQRKAAFWIGVVCLFGGGVVPGSVRVGDQELAGIVIALGAVVLTVGCSSVSSTFFGHRSTCTK